MSLYLGKSLDSSTGVLHVHASSISKELLATNTPIRGTVFHSNITYLTSVDPSIISISVLNGYCFVKVDYSTYLYNPHLFIVGGSVVNPLLPVFTSSNNGFTTYTLIEVETGKIYTINDSQLPSGFSMINTAVTKSGISYGQIPEPPSIWQYTKTLVFKTTSVVDIRKLNVDYSQGIYKTIFQTSSSILVNRSSFIVNGIDFLNTKVYSTDVLNARDEVLTFSNGSKIQFINSNASALSSFGISSSAGVQLKSDNNTIFDSNSGGYITESQTFSDIFVRPPSSNSDKKFICTVKEGALLFSSVSVKYDQTNSWYTLAYTNYTVSVAALGNVIPITGYKGNSYLKLEVEIIGNGECNLYLSNFGPSIYDQNTTLRFKIYSLYK